MEIALAKGKNLHDKREAQKTKDAQREIQKALKNRYQYVNIEHPGGVQAFDR